MRPDREAYARSEIDWGRLEAYARRVARETRREKAQRRVEIVETIPKRENRFFGLVSWEVTEEVKRIEPALQDYWVLLEQYFKETTIHQRNPFHRLIEIEWFRYCLGQDGSLFVESWTDLESIQQLNSGAPLNSFNTFPSERSRMTARDVERFDYRPRHYLTESGNVTIDRSDGLGDLHYHAKGVGLSKALGQLLR